MLVVITNIFMLIICAAFKQLCACVFMLNMFMIIRCIVINERVMCVVV